MKERVLTAIVLLAVVVGALFFDPTGWAVKVLVVLIAGICSYEFCRLIKILPTVWGFLPGLIIASLISGKTLHPWTFPVMALVGVLIVIWGVNKQNKMASGGAGFLWLYGTLFPISILAATKSPSTWSLLLSAAIPIWCGDTAAIFVGKAFGKHKLAPSISPNKTWEGLIGNLLACVGAALALGAIFHYPMPLMVLLGLNCGILGQAGDLFESWLKRKADVKDSGNILPGHGGLLDRLDSLMATAPLSLLILQSLVVPGTPK